MDGGAENRRTEDDDTGRIRRKAEADGDSRRSAEAASANRII